MTPGQDRFFEGCCAAIYHCMTVRGSNDRDLSIIPQYLVDQLNSVFDFDRSTKFVGKVDGNNLKVWNEKVTLNYVEEGSFFGKRSVSIELKSQVTTLF